MFYIYTHQCIGQLGLLSTICSFVLFVCFLQKAKTKLHDGLCQHCKDVLEWKVKYNKYKPLTQPRKWWVQFSEYCLSGLILFWNSIWVAITALDAIDTTVSQISSLPVYSNADSVGNYIFNHKFSKRLLCVTTHIFCAIKSYDSVKCSQKTVKDAYHIICKPCSLQLEVCCKCGKKEEIVIPWVLCY